VSDLAATWGEALRREADRRRMPLRTIKQVRNCLDKARKTDADKPMARLMLRHGRLTDEARAFVEAYTQ
jgi:hypothetical protein